MEDGRYPLSVRLIGVLYKEKSKLFMTSVLWSDDNDIVVYRTFREFQKMHKQLKKSFPPANPLKKSGRIVPRFHDKRMRRSRQKKAHSKSLARLKFLQKYCEELLRSDPQVTQSPQLIEFFQPRAQDLQPEFTTNSVMIMPSDDTVTNNNGGNGGGGGGGNVTQPFVTETYSCVAPYETKDTKNKPFKVEMGEKVDVLIKDKGGWWLVENEDKRMAWFPAPYLERLEDDEDDGVDDLDASGRGKLYTAIKSYKATKSDEISVTIGTVVEVLQTSENGWWLIRCSNKAGYIPALYLQPFSHPQLRLAALQTTQHDPARLQMPSQKPCLSPTTDLTRDLGLAQSQRLSHSQRNLLQDGAHISANHRSQSLEVLSHSTNQVAYTTNRAVSPPTSTTSSTGTSPSTTNPSIPVIKIEGQEHSEASISSGSSSFSLSDNLSVSSVSLLSWSHPESNLHLSRTPPPPSSRNLTTPEPTDAGGKPTLSGSDQNLYRSTKTTPRVPPRPQAREILTRCTTITRKNLARGALMPPPQEIQSR